MMYRKDIILLVNYITSKVDFPCAHAIEDVKCCCRRRSSGALIYLPCGGLLQDESRKTHASGRIFGSAYLLWLCPFERRCTRDNSVSFCTFCLWARGVCAIVIRVRYHYFPNPCRRRVSFLVMCSETVLGELSLQYRSLQLYVSILRDSFTFFCILRFRST